VGFTRQHPDRCSSASTLSECQFNTLLLSVYSATYARRRFPLLPLQPHLLKLFDNVKELSFGRAGGGRAVLSLSSTEGETLRLAEPVSVDGAAVEVWLGRVEAAMKASLRAVTKEGVFSYASTPRLAWAEACLGMVAVLGSQIWWTWEVEDAFRAVKAGRKGAVKELGGKLTGQLMELVGRVRGPLSRTARTKVNTLLTVDVHARDIVDSFVRESVTDGADFAWESQLRGYWDRGADDVRIKQCTGAFHYGWEMVGLGRLVQTPLTDR
jgi:dynein heavy chain